MTPSLIGRIARIEPGVLPTISLASVPTASTFRVPFGPSATATTDGSLQMIPRPLT
jgi:hypothetical protein